MIRIAHFLDAGPFRLDVVVPPGDGVFVQAYGFASNPAVHVRLGSAGWADFGRGIVPAGLGLATVDAVDFAVMGPGAARDQALALAPGLVLKKEFGGDGTWFERFRARFGRRVDVARQLLTRSLKAPIGTGTDLSDAALPDSEAEQWWAGSRLRTLREARGLTLDDAAGLANRLAPGLPVVSRDHVQRLELGRSPRVDQLVPRLDMVYRADGRTCVVGVDVATTSAGIYEVRFPSYWVGPVWVAFHGATAGHRATARLIWKPWRKTLQLSHDVVVTCRRSTQASDPLLIDAPPGWAVSAGVGVHASAVDVNEGWGFVDAAMARDALTHYYQILLLALRQDPG